MAHSEVLQPVVARCRSLAPGRYGEVSHGFKRDFLGNEAKTEVKMKKKRKLPKERNFLVPMMRLHCKPGPHRDGKKEASRRACRIKWKPGGIYPPGFFFYSEFIEIADRDFWFY
jgi:hypothetical protein